VPGRPSENLRHQHRPANTRRSILSVLDLRRQPGEESRPRSEGLARIPSAREGRTMGANGGKCEVVEQGWLVIRQAAPAAPRRFSGQGCARGGRPPGMPPRRTPRSRRAFKPAGPRSRRRLPRWGRRKLAGSRGRRRAVGTPPRSAPGPPAGPLCPGRGNLPRCRCAVKLNRCHSEPTPTSPQRLAYTRASRIFTSSSG
jgi:hypothetical protein